MATITFLSAADASMHSVKKVSSIEKIQAEVEIINEEDHRGDLCEYSFFEAAPVLVSAIPEDSGLTLKDIFIDESSDDDIQITDEIAPIIPGLSTTEYEKIKTAIKPNREEKSPSIEAFITMTKDNPHVTISMANFEQIINVKPPTRLELKTDKFSQLLEDLHTNLKIQPSVVLKKIYVQPSQMCQQLMNKDEVKTESNDFNISEENVDDIFFNTWPKNFTDDSSDHYSFEGFNLNANSEVIEERLSTLTSILKKILHEQKDVLAEVREFDISSLLGKKYGEINEANGDKICKLCKETLNTNNVYCKCMKQDGGSSLNHVNIAKMNKQYRCYYCDCSVEDINTLDQHYMIHSKVPIVRCENLKELPKYGYTADVPKKRNATVSSMRPNLSLFKENVKTNKMPTIYKNCVLCECKFLYFAKLQNHYLKIHKTFKCAHCSKDLRNKISLSKHLYIVHLVKWHPCQY